MKLIVGLGNPGEKYEKTRHNLGFMIVEQFLKDLEPVEKTTWSFEEKVKSDLVVCSWQPRQRRTGKTYPEKVILVKPRTYMNNSGMAVKLALNYWRLEVGDLWVVYDDVDVPLGGMKIRFGGASAGHHGVDSVMQYVGTDKFWRFRMGIGERHQHVQKGDEEIKGKYFQKRSLKNVDDYVLDKFTGSQWGKTRELIKRGSRALQTALEDGLEVAMNRFNTK